MNIKPKKYDIYDTEQGITTGETSSPYPMVNDILSVDALRYCFFVVWVKRDGYKKELPVLDTHLSLVLCEKTADHNYDVYKYNSGIVDEENEYLLDMSILDFFKLVQSRSHHLFNIVPTTSWCPKHLQGTSNLCTVFAFNIYYYLNRNRKMSIKDIIATKLQEMSNILPFLEKLSVELPGTGEHEISLQ